MGGYVARHSGHGVEVVCINALNRVIPLWNFEVREQVDNLYRFG